MRPETKPYNDEIDKFRLEFTTQIDVIISLNNNFTALKSINTLKYDIWITYVGIKLKLGELPKNAKELNEFLFSNFF